MFTFSSMAVHTGYQATRLQFCFAFVSVTGYVHLLQHMVPALLPITPADDAHNAVGYVDAFYIGKKCPISQVWQQLTGSRHVAMQTKAAPALYPSWHCNVFRLSLVLQLSMRISFRFVYRLCSPSPAWRSTTATKPPGCSCVLLSFF